MMKTRLILFLIFISLFANICEVKSQAFQEGKSYVQASYGFGNFIQAVFKTYETYDGYESKIMGPMFGRYEYAVSDKMGIGINFAYASANISYIELENDPTYGDVNAEINWATYSILARFNMHFGENDKLDPYWGVGMGWRTANWDVTYSDPNYTGSSGLSNLMPFGFETTFGCRYMFVPSFGIYGEVGIAKAVIQFGLVGSF